MSAKKPPFVVRWRNGVMDDPNPVLSWRAIAAAMPLVRHADLNTGHNCYPGAGTCAREMRLSVKTIERGWAELVEAGWLELMPLPASRRRSQGALKVLRWPKRPASPTGSDIPPDRGEVTTYPLTVHDIPPDSRATYSGNQGGPDGPLRAGEPLGGRPAREDKHEECSICRKRALLSDGLCATCLAVWQSGDPEAVERLTR